MMSFDKDFFNLNLWSEWLIWLRTNRNSWKYSLEFISNKTMTDTFMQNEIPKKLEILILLSIYSDLFLLNFFFVEWSFLVNENVWVCVEEIGGFFFLNIKSCCCYYCWLVWLVDRFSCGFIHFERSLELLYTGNDVFLACRVQYFICLYGFFFSFKSKQMYQRGIYTINMINYLF